MKFSIQACTLVLFSLCLHCRLQETWIPKLALNELPRILETLSEQQCGAQQRQSVLLPLLGSFPSRVISVSAHSADTHTS